VLSLARSTIFSSTTLSSSSANVQRDRPLGGSEQASAISLASAAPSKTRLRAEFLLVGEDRVEAVLDQPLAYPREGGDTGIQRFHDAAVAPALTRIGDIRLEQHTSLQDRGGGMLTFADQIFQR
jgi:hypothetical protein